MPENLDNNGIELKLGVVIGQQREVKEAVQALSKRFEEHLKEHRSTWLWVIPTIISLATLTVLIVSCFR